MMTLSLRFTPAFLLVLVLGAIRPMLAEDTAPGSRGTQPPNILFILTDDQRWDMAACMGNTVIRTPNLDRIANEGAKFNNYYCGAPLCAPSRALILTGLYPHQIGNGVLQNSAWAEFDEDTPTVASLLNNAGYITSFVGKAHLGGDPRSWGFQHTPLWLRKAANNHDNPRLISEGREKRFKDLNDTSLFGRAAVEFITRRAGQTEPWFLYLSTTAPHGPSCPSCQNRYPYNLQNILNNPPPGFPPGHTVEFDWVDYYSQISHLDHEVGRILDALDSTNQSSNTYVFFTSDNGLTLGQFNEPAKGTWYDESSKVLFLAKGPGIAPGTVIDDPAVGVDVLPTILEIAGVTAPENLEGMSLVPVLTGGQPLRTIAYSEVAGNSFPQWQMVVPFSGPATGYKYVIGVGTGEEHLYNLATDPFELNDLLPTSPPGGILNQLVGLHQAWINATR